MQCRYVKLVRGKSIIGATNRTVWMRNEPHIYARDMKRVQALRQCPQFLSLFEFPEAHGARTIVLHPASSSTRALPIPMCPNNIITNLQRPRHHRRIRRLGDGTTSTSTTTIAYARRRRAAAAAAKTNGYEMVY